MEDANEFLVDDGRPLLQVQGLPPPLICQDVLAMLVEHRWLTERPIRQRIPEAARPVTRVDLHRRGVAGDSSHRLSMENR